MRFEIFAWILSLLFVSQPALITPPAKATRAPLSPYDATAPIHYAAAGLDAWHYIQMNAESFVDIIIMGIYAGERLRLPPASL